MIFRAIFWIGLVAVMMPHEPDLGFGRPDSIASAADGAVTSEVASWAQSKISPTLKDPQALCHYNAEACNAGATFMDGVRESAIRSLASVKADIHASRQAQDR